MNEHRVDCWLRIATAFAAFSMLAPSVPAQSQTSERQPQRAERVIRGHAVTGHNDVLGHPFFDWGPPFGTFGFATLGAYNANGPDPLPLTEETPLSALVATRVDPNLLASTGVDPSEMDPAWLNVPLRDVPVQYSFGATKPFPGMFSAGSSEKAQAAPDYPITLRQWMRAEGTARISCDSDKRAFIRLRLRNLIPNRMYAVWATLGQSKSGTGEVFPSIPVGGTPNIFVTNYDGSATYERWIQFCPLHPETTDRAMLVINVQYHSNHQNYGGINGPPIERIPGGYWIGTVIHNHIQFPVNVTLLDNER